ncbi:hypothetical protein D3C84_1254440 [compost metagenome]
MGFNVINVCDIERGILKRFPDHFFLRSTVRRGQTTATSILVYCTAFDNREHRIIIPQRI